jgi:hypothetical protein
MSHSSKVNDCGWLQFTNDTTHSVVVASITYQQFDVHCMQKFEPLVNELDV